MGNDVIVHCVSQSQSLVKPLQSIDTEKPNFRGSLLDGFPDGVKYSPSLQLLELVKNRITTRNSIAQNQQQLFALQNPTEDLLNADMEV